MRSWTRVTLSIVVPVHAVEKYLVQCLDSIQAGLSAPESAAIEIVAVDDASPDRCGRMLDDYAATHDGVRVVHLAHNVGLGLARNAGLAEATGDYVWFVDSDDWLPAGSVSAVLAALAEHRPEVLFIDHLRAHENGRLEVDTSSPLLAGPATTDRLLGLQHTAWNRIVDRSFLLRHGLRFGPGWYEDVPFSHPVVLAADRPASLDRVCYHYRIGRPGAITATRSDRHFEAFEQYDALQRWLTRHRIDPELRRRLFSLTISHLLVVVGNENRMHPSRRRAFFHRVAAYYRQHRPEGYRPPPGAKGLKQRLVALDSYALYALIRAGYRLAALRRRPPVEPAEVAAPAREPVSA